MLLLLDRAYYSFAWLSELRRRQADFVVRIKQGGCSLRPKKRQRLGPCDWLGELPLPSSLRRKRADLPDRLPVRVLTFRRKGFRTMTLVTSLLDAARFPAEEVCARYLDRWEAELGYRELKVHLGEREAVFRSQKPERVRQEAYGLLIAFTCVRALMAEAAATVGVRPIELSFVACLQNIRLELTRLVSCDDEVALGRLLDALGRHRLPPRRKGRRYERAVKRKMSNFPRKRRGQKATATRRRQSAARNGRAA
jgi:hypothetical protein